MQPGRIHQRPQMAGSGARPSGVTRSRHRGRFRSSDGEGATGCPRDGCPEPRVPRAHHPSNFLRRRPCRVIEGRVVDWERLEGGDGRDRDDGGRDWGRLGRALPRQSKKQREGLALLVATALDVRDVNLMELAAALPRAAERLDRRYQWISRLLGNALIDTDEVIAPFAREVLARAGADGRTLVLIIDQSQINTEHQMVMVSLRVGGRALPLAWRVKKTSGA